MHQPRMPIPMSVMPITVIRTEQGRCGQVVAFVVALGLSAPTWALDCSQLQEQRDQLARRAMAAEVALVHAQRQTLCPQLEALATADGKTYESNAGLPEQLDYGAYISCREQAETRLMATHPVLYKSNAGFPFLTPDGARLARQADALIKAQPANCSAPPSATEPARQPSRPGP
jgi:hypothetical protein